MTSSPTVLRRPDRLYDGYVFDLDGTVYLATRCCLARPR